MDAKPVVHHEANAADLSARYESADIAPTHTMLLRHLAPHSRVLEIGCVMAAMNSSAEKIYYLKHDEGLE
tara:strand:+ start:969 stop:1178 length:210 start_codon:yes stop_codon:yes gene_type:complete